MCNGLAKSKVALDFKIKMLDLTILGLGRGAGNLQSELLIMELSKNNPKLNLEQILDYGSKYIKHFNDKFEKSKFIYNNSILYALTGYFSIHPDYVDYICEKYSNINIKYIYKLFQNISKDNIDSFNKDYVDNLLKNI